MLTWVPEDPTGYGRLEFAADGSVARIIEQKDCSPEQDRNLRSCNPGFYAFDAATLAAHISELSCANAQHELYLTDMVEILQAHGERVSAIEATDTNELLGVNERLMAEGVTMLDPSLVWVGPDATVGRDTELLPQTMLWGQTHVGEGCVVGPNTRLTDCSVGDGSSVEETVGIQATIEKNVTVGPRAYLRPGAHLLDRAHVGTHVEIKNSTIGVGSKVPHLSYIGDTTMGSGVNIGAGSITCNYDGVHKHRTTIGNDVFVGSDTMMVAPVTIGDGALVGASSCITHDVPSGALALERNEERIVEGYAAKRLDRLRRDNA
jgi:bifunctional UDP-N-acetylglucosamine pyrophosphorylase/glucosamine-1-phosphate N-acetyltransferase